MGNQSSDVLQAGHFPSANLWLVDARRCAYILFDDLFFQSRRNAASMSFLTDVAYHRLDADQVDHTQYTGNPLGVVASTAEVFWYLLR